MLVSISHLHKLAFLCFISLIAFPLNNAQATIASTTDDASTISQATTEDGISTASTGTTTEVTETTQNSESSTTRINEEDPNVRPHQDSVDTFGYTTGASAYNSTCYCNNSDTPALSTNLLIYLAIFSFFVFRQLSRTKSCAYANFPSNKHFIATNSTKNSLD